MPGSEIRAGKPSGGDTASRSYKESMKEFQGRTEIQPSLETKTSLRFKRFMQSMFDEVSRSYFERTEKPVSFQTARVWHDCCADAKLKTIKGRDRWCLGEYGGAWLARISS